MLWNSQDPSSRSLAQYESMEEAHSIHMALCPWASGPHLCVERGFQPGWLLHMFYYRDQMREQMLKGFENIDHFTVLKWDHILKGCRQKTCLPIIKNIPIVLSSFRDSKSRVPNSWAKLIWSVAVRDWAAQQEVSGVQRSKASSAAPHRSHYTWISSFSPYLCKHCLPWNWVPGAKKLGTTALNNQNVFIIIYFKTHGISNAIKS